jgi:uncharacterized protein YneF (UPF0154 family)
MNSKYLIIIVLIFLFGILLGIWLRPYFFKDGLDVITGPPVNTTRLTVDFATPPADFGRRLSSTETGNTPQAFQQYMDILQNNSVNIGGNPVSMDRVFQDYEVISIEALSELIHAGQNRTDPANVVNPAYIVLRPGISATSPTDPTPVVKNHLFLLDAAGNIIRDANGPLMYDDMRRCPSWCNNNWRIPRYIRF